MQPLAPCIFAARRRSILAAWLLGGLPAFGATYTVTSTEDTGAVGTLRWAIEQANANADADTITLANNLGTITLESALPMITHAVSIEGGTGNTISGNNAHRIFFVSTANSTDAVLFSNLTLADGYAKGGDGGSAAGGGLGAGGAIFVNTGAVNLSQVNFHNNAARGGNGGDGTAQTHSGAPVAGGGGGLGGNGGDGNNAAGGGGGGFGGDGGDAGPVISGGSTGGGGGGIIGNGAPGIFGGGGGGGSTEANGVNPGLGGGRGGDFSQGNGQDGQAPGGGGGGGGGSYTSGEGGNGAWAGGGGGNSTTGGAHGPEAGDGGDFGGGGGATGYYAVAGDGGFGGGGGGAGRWVGATLSDPGMAGDGGFGGGGGGASWPNLADLDAGRGGAYGGRGGVYWGRDVPVGGGGGGGALGGAIFVRDGNGASLTFMNSTETDSTVTAGQAGFMPDHPSLGPGGYGLWAQDGSAAGAAIFLPSGVTAFGNGSVQGNISGVDGAGIRKTGLGTLTLSGMNDFNGGANLQNGVLELGSSGALGTAGPISFTGGTLRFTEANSVDYSSRFANTSGQVYGIDTNGQNVTFASRVASQNGSLTKIGTGTLTFSGTTDNSALAVVVNQGAVLLAKISSSDIHAIGGGAPTANLIVNSGALAQLGGTGDDQIYEGAVVQVNSGGWLDLNGRNEGFASLLGSGTVSNSAANTIGILTLGETNASSTLNAVLSDGAGILSLAKAGSGTLTLATAAGFSGTTTIQGGTLRLSGAGRLSHAGAVHVDSGATLDLNGINQTVGAVTGSGTVALGSGTLMVASVLSNTYGGNISGSGGLIKTGSGTFALSANTAYTGTTAIHGGTLSLAGTSASTAFAIASGATLELAPAANYTASTVFSGAGVLRKTGSVTARWTDAAATFALESGSLIDVQGGTFVGGANGNEVWTNNKSDLNVAGGAIFNGVEANVRVDAISGSGIIRSGFNGAGYQGFTFGVDNGSGTFAGELTDNPGAGVGANYTKSGTGTQTLTGNNSHTGTTTLQAGTLALGSAGALGSIGVISFTGGTLQFSAANTTDYSSRFANTSGQIYGIDTNGQNVTFASRVASPGGSLTKTGAGALTLSGTADNTALAVVVNGGTVVLAKESSANVHAIGGGAPVANLIVHSGGTARLAGTGGDQIFSGATVQVNTGGVFDLNGRSEGFSVLSGSGTVSNSAAGTTGTLTLGEGNSSSTLAATVVNGTGTAALAKVGTGTLTLSGNNTFSGGTRVRAGSLVAGHNQAAGTGTVTVEGGIFLVETGVTLGNNVVLSGGRYFRSLAAGANLANAVNATSGFADGPADTTAKILQGSLTAQDTLETGFQNHSNALNDTIRLSDVYSLHGTGNDKFVLQLSLAGLTANSQLGWLDTDSDSATYNAWINAVEGNTGGTPTFFARAYNAATDFHLGYYGVDVAAGTVWAVLNHNSDFAIIPEPGSFVLASLGALLLLRRRRVP